MTQQDTLNSTFQKFFGPTEDDGTGCAIRLVDGVLTRTVTNKEKHARWLAAERAKADRHNAETKAIDELMKELMKWEE